MKTEKRALRCVFKPGKMKTTAEMREWFMGSYPKFMAMESLEFKCWWCNQEKQEWGALYIFKSAEAVEEYVKSDVWLKVVPEKYGCVPTWDIVETGLILSKKEITSADDSWMSD
ncbi:MAG: hypothetical protein JXO49_11560 [Deltaproteobacteria bacterium]|nr:hypothetical protein [Candidatus Anaeroferrophillus wilburensis]MBN2889970.1 hypothetical protein [Deltaproteobacteria bacterium]